MYLKARYVPAQEWYLSRRKLFFMLGGISWICDGAENNERGKKYRDLHEQVSWPFFLQHYTDT